MGFLRKLFPRSFDDCGQMIRSLDERMSKVEGVGGNFEPKRDVNLGKNVTMDSVAKPTKVNQAARYNNSSRYRTMSFGKYYGNTQLAEYINKWHYIGKGSGELCYKPDSALEANRLFLTARSFGLSGTRPTSNLTAYVYCGSVGISRVAASISLWSRGPLAGMGYHATNVSTKSYRHIPRLGNLWFAFFNGVSSHWTDAEMIVEFKVVDS